MAQDKSLEEKAREYLASIGYSQFRLDCTEKNTPHGLEAMIDTKTYKIGIEYDAEWREKYEEAKRLHEEYRKKQSAGIVKRIGSILKGVKSNGSPVDGAYGTPDDVLKAVTYHEHGHWQYCPYDIKYLEAILDNVAQGLKSGGLSDDEAKQKTWGKANEFEDIVDNLCLALDHPETAKGRSTKYLREAFVNDPNKPEIPTGYAVFIDSQLRVINPEADFVKDYAKKYEKEVKPVSDEILMEFGKEHQLGPSAVKGTLSDEEKSKFVQSVRDPKNWPRLAYEYARITAKLDPNQNEPMSAMMQKAMQDPDYRSQLIQVALQAGHDPGQYMDNFEVFQQEHKLSGARMRHDIFSGKPGDVPQFALQYAYLSSQKTDNPLRASLGKTRANISGGLQFRARAYPLVLPPSVKSTSGSLADLLFVCDNSGSMQGMKYGLLTDTAYALFEGLTAERKAHLLKYGLLQFSDSVCQSWTGWQNSTEPLEKEFYKTMNGGKFGGSTQMPIDLLKSADKKGSALVGISDGQIENASETIDALLEHDGPLVWFQIAEDSEVYRAMKAYAQRNSDKYVVAHMVTDISDLPQSLLQVANHLYKRNK